MHGSSRRDVWTHSLCACRPLKAFLVELAKEWVTQKTGRQLQAQYKLPKMRYKGSEIQPQVSSATSLDMLNYAKHGCLYSPGNGGFLYVRACNSVKCQYHQLDSGFVLIQAVQTTSATFQIVLLMGLPFLLLDCTGLVRHALLSVTQH